MATEYSLLTWAGLGTTVTFTDAGDVVNFTAHGAPNGHAFRFTTTGTLPTGLTAGTTYYLRQGADANKFTIYPTQADAIAGTNRVTFTGTGSGTHKVVGEYWSALDTAGRARYGTAGSERVYGGMYYWESGLSALASQRKQLTLEILDQFDDTYSSYTAGHALAGYFSITITSKVNGVYSPAYHGGVVGGGYRRIDSYNGAVINPNTQLGVWVDGLELIATNAAGAGVGAGTTAHIVSNCIIKATINGIAPSSGNCLFYNNLIHDCGGNGIVFYAYTGGTRSYNNTIVGCGGVGVQGVNSYINHCVGTVSVGNSTNWGTACSGGFWANNGGATGDTIWTTSGETNITGITSADFANYIVPATSASNFAPSGSSASHTSSSKLVDAGSQLIAEMVAIDITNNVRPRWKNGTVTNWDIGAYEFDWGYGLSPISVTFTDIEDGSTIRVFTTGTTTELASTTNSSGDFLASGASGTVDYTIYKDGYIPIRVTGVALYDGISISGTQTVDRAYAASSGLSYGTTATINTTTKIFTLTTPSTGQNWYSFWAEQYRTHTDLRNKDFPLQANGPNSFSLRLGYEFDGSTSIANLSRDGIRYVDTSEAQTAVWSALLSVGVPSGARVRYQQTDGGTTVNAVITSGNIDELIQVYGDATHGNFDRRGYLVCKVQEQGYDQVETDVVAQYGTLEDQLYVIGLAPPPNSIATGNPSLANPPTITDHAGSPVTWNSKAFSITIEDSAAGNTGTNIMKWLRYYFETGGTFQGKDAFNWHDLVQQNGSDFKSVRGKIYGDTGAALKGVRVIQNGTTDPHNDFTLFTADDGTTYAPPVVAAAEAAILAGSRVQLFNVTTDTEIDNTFVAGTSYSYTITTEASVGDTLRLNVCKMGRQSTPAYAVWAASGVTFLVDQPEETIYTSWGIDGSTVTEFALDITGTVEIDANDVDGATLKTRLGAWYNYILTTESGIRYLYGAITFLAANAIRINVDVLDLQIENINATTALRFTDLDVRLFRSDGSSIIAPTSYSLHNDYTGVPDVSIVTVSGESVITGDIADVAAEVQTALTAQGYTVTRAPKLDNLDIAVSEAGGGGGGLTTEEHNQLMSTLTKNQFNGLK